MENGECSPGFSQIVIVGDARDGNAYRAVGRSFVDSQLLDVSCGMRSLLSEISTHISVRSPVDIGGSSWEMSAVMALIGRPGTYTGTVDSVELEGGGIRITFGAVPFVGMKSEIKQVVTSTELSSVLVPFSGLER
jgi:hypothetical protein